MNDIYEIRSFYPSCCYPNMPRDSADSNDPLSLALTPPHDETPDEEAERLAKEAEARRISNEIDADLKAEAAVLKKRKKTLKLLLLGQSESGKSTTLKSTI
jgi:guanine nucleotide-binding protein subunit alpha